MRDISAGPARQGSQASPLRYLPATLLAGVGLTFLLHNPSVSRWARPHFYAAFLNGKGAPAPSRKVAIVTVGNPDGDPSESWRAPELSRVVLALERLRPAAIALDLPRGLPLSVGADSLAGAPPLEPVALSHGFKNFRSWTLPETPVAPYPPLLTRSLYPLLDGSVPGLSLPMGEGLELPDSLLDWPGTSTGFSGPLESERLYSVPAFARLGRGVSASLGVEAVRLALGIPADRIGHVEGVGVVFDNGHILPLDKRGEILLRFHASGDIPVIPAWRILEGRLGPEEIIGKVLFLGPAPGQLPLIRTVAGGLSETEVWATAAANLLEGNLISMPTWGGVLAKTLGLAFSALLILSLFAQSGGMGSFGLAILLAGLYPAVSYWLFLAYSWWLPPEIPFLMVIVTYLPFGLTRLSLRRTLPPVPAFAPFQPHSAPVARTPAPAPVVALPPSPVTPSPAPAHSTPALAAPAPAAPAPAPWAHAVPATPPSAAVQAMMAGPAPSETTPPPVAAARAPQPAPVPQSKALRPPPPRERLGHIPPVAPAPVPENPPRSAEPPKSPIPSAQGQHTGTISDEIERDAKGGLIRVGKYRIVRKMGFGSGGDVFEGFDTHMGRKVAIKTITKDAAAHFDRALERFAVEAKAAGSLNHPHINIIYDFGRVGDVSYMVLEFLDGITLSQWMRTHPVPRPAEVAPWLQQMCSALDYAHAHKVVHRDLKPSNLMVVNEGATLKLLDFGIAKLEDIGLTQTGMTVGTPSYMSPEQLTGSNVGPASDQYGLAVVIYQLLTYKLPYVGTKIPELCNRILKNEIIPITLSNPALGVAFWEALRKAMAKAPEERYPNCAALYQALEATFADDLPVSPLA